MLVTSADMPIAKAGNSFRLYRFHIYPLGLPDLYPSRPLRVSSSQGFLNTINRLRLSSQAVCYIRKQARHRLSEYTIAEGTFLYPEPSGLTGCSKL